MILVHSQVGVIRSSSHMVEKESQQFGLFGARITEVGLVRLDRLFNK